MTNMKVLTENASAAMDNKKLSDHDIDYLKHYARETAQVTVLVVRHLCEPIIDDKVPVSDIMRYLMYSRSYGEHERAKLAFKELPSEVRKCMVNLNYRLAEQKCPQKIKIGRLMREANIELGQS